MTDDIRLEGGFRIFVLGAGFSRPAGLPLGPELWDEVRRRGVRIGGRDGHFQHDLDSYLRFKRECDGQELTEEDVDFERFLAHLDLEFFLGLRGSDTWSNDGNETQVIVKTLIGEILVERTPQIDSLPELYYDFAELLGRGDFVLTFNYDTVLERALEHVGKPFRLFPERYKAIRSGYAVGDDSEDFRDEIAVLKMHGSVNWFDRTGYTHLEESFKEMHHADPPKHPVFGPNSNVKAVPLLEGPQFPDDPLRSMYRVVDIEALYAQQILFRATPWLLAPSTSKIVFAKTLESFWRGIGKAGGLNLGVAIVGYSLPEHDDYAKQALYKVVKNFQGYYWEEPIAGRRKSPVLMIDRKLDAESATSYRQRYAFVDARKAHFHLGGFDQEAIRLIRAPDDDSVPEVRGPQEDVKRNRG